GILQSYFDGELSIDMMEKVSSHLTSCLACKRAARELESESLLLSEALEPEFRLSVPSERLRARIEMALAAERLRTPARATVAGRAGLVASWFQSLSELITVSPQRAFGYAGLVMVLLFAALFAVVRFLTTPGPTANPPSVAVVTTPSPKTVSPPESVPTPKQTAPQNTVPTKGPRRDVQPKFVPVKGAERANDDQAPRVKLLPGERSYLKTIAALDSSLKSKNATPMRPSL